MQRKSEADIVATAAVVTVSLMLALRIIASYTFKSNDNILGEIPKKVQSLIFCFIGLPQEEIIKIFHNRFISINLYCLCHIRGHLYKLLYD